MSSRVIYPTNYTGKVTIFAAGSITGASDWQKRFITEVQRNIQDVVVFNPRREDWDASWETESPQLVEQIEWELEHIRKAKHVFMFFEAGTKSPITLLELGLFARHRGLVVCCEKGYEKYTNVKVVCREYDVRMVSSVDEFISLLLNKSKL